MVNGNLRHDHQQAVTERHNRIHATWYENLGLLGEIKTKDQERAAL